MPEFAPVLWVERKDSNEIKEAEQEIILKHIKEIVIKLELKDFEGNLVTPWLLYEQDEIEKSVVYAMFELCDWEDTPEETKKLNEILRIGSELNKRIPNTYNYECNCEII